MARLAVKEMTLTSTTGTLNSKHPRLQMASAPLPRRNLQRRVSNRHGFTLLELIIVCLLITISLAVGVPSFRQALVVDELAASSRMVIALVREARITAANTQTPQQLFVDLDKGRVWFAADTQPAQATQKKSTSDQQTERDAVPEPATGAAVVRLMRPVRFQDVQSGGPDRKNGGTIPLWISPQGYMEPAMLHLTDDQEVISLSLSPFHDTIKTHDQYVGLE